METNIYGDVLAVTGDDGTRHLIPLDAIASWDELLGCDTDTSYYPAAVPGPGYHRHGVCRQS